MGRMFITVCPVCGTGNRMARLFEKYYPVAGSVEKTFCWKCMEHTKQKVSPWGCVTVWDEDCRDGSVGRAAHS